MNIHEYQAKELLAKFGVPVPIGFAALSVEEAVEAAKKLPGPLYVVKAQIHAGGRVIPSSPRSMRDSPRDRRAAGWIRPRGCA